jgi:hypothetical protein
MTYTVRPFEHAGLTVRLVVDDDGGPCELQQGRIEQ